VSTPYHHPLLASHHLSLPPLLFFLSHVFPSASSFPPSLYHSFPPSIHLSPFLCLSFPPVSLSLSLPVWPGPCCVERTVDIHQKKEDPVCLECLLYSTH